MTVLIERETRLEAWIAGVEHLLPRKRDFNVILSIQNPSSNLRRTGATATCVDRFLTSEGEYPLQTVAETIFPAVEYRKHGAEGVYTVYPEQTYPAIDDRWGTYAHRLVRRSTADRGVINPLREMIGKMRGKDTKKSCFEIGIAEGAYDLPLHNTVDDRKLIMGGPCLSHLSFKKADGRVYLSAMYRSHDYRYKVLGNLLGLARLQRFVCEQVGLEMGPLVVHSTYATLEKAGGPVRQLLEDIRATPAEQEAPDDVA